MRHEFTYLGGTFLLPHQTSDHILHNVNIEDDNAFHQPMETNAFNNYKGIYSQNRQQTPKNSAVITYK